MDSVNVAWTGSPESISTMQDPNTQITNRLNGHIEDENVPANSRKLSKYQIFTLVSTASLNFSSMICYSILGPFFPQEALKKGVSNTVIGLIFGCFAFFNFATSLTLGKHGCLELFTGMGFVLGPPIGGLLYESFGYETPFIVLGCIVLLMVPLNMFILPRYDAVPSKDSFWALLALPKVMLMCFTMISISTSLGVLDPTLSLFVIDKFHLKVVYVGLVFLGLALSYSLSSPILGLITDRFPGLRKWILIAGNLGSAFCFFLLGPAPIFHIER
ncbi:hypothetical protein XELAEV_18000106mg [Xenopus laevis]|uniref:Major facilitator superfamily (MFS) profile domain-containing protein n=1 Tax=Xenopus laevis TaxID=8355 RepID=A0A974BQV1_XENLA|nr:hypothetical protein XELAEV_18000106mg [Xenopus laevis]